MLLIFSFSPLVLGPLIHTYRLHKGSSIGFCRVVDQMKSESLKLSNEGSHQLKISYKSLRETDAERFLLSFTVSELRAR